MRVIPAIDIRKGSCVRLYQGDFEQQTTYEFDPVELATTYAALGFEVLHLVDLDGAKQGTPRNRELVAQISAVSGLQIQLGGGIRTTDIVRAWLGSGIHRCVIGSIAVEDPQEVHRWITKYGAEHIVLAFDLRLRNGEPVLATHGWTRESDVNLWPLLDEYVSHGVKHLLCTDIDRDGALTGPNLGLYRDIMARFPTVQLQASGGVRSIDDLLTLKDCGVAAAITGRAMLDGRISNEEISKFLRVA